MLGCKIAEYAKAVCADKPALPHQPGDRHLALLRLPRGKRRGGRAGRWHVRLFDPVAIDMACADAVNAQPPIENSMLGECEHTHHDHFTDISPTTDWRSQTEHAEKIGLGSRKYELVRI